MSANITNDNRTPSDPAARSAAWLGEDNIKNTLMRIDETADCSWTELCIKTVQELARPLQEEIEKCKADRNRIGMMERRKYLPTITKLTAEIKHAIETLEADGDEHGVASVLRKALRDTSPNPPKLRHRRYEG